MVMKSRTIAAGEFKAKCLALLDEVRDQHEEIIVTKHGKPVARLVPVDDRGRPSLAGAVIWMGDVESPIDETWDADQ